MDGTNQAPQAQQPVNSTPPSVNNSSGSKLIPIILGIAAVVIIAIGAYALGTKQSQPIAENSVQPTPSPSPTPDPTANWKTYTNTQGGFTLQYPPSYSIRTLDKSPVIDLEGATLEKDKSVIAGGGMGGGDALKIHYSIMSF